MKRFLKFTFILLSLLCVSCQSISVPMVETQTATQLAPTVYPSKTFTPVKSETSVVKTTNTPTDIYLDFKNIKPGQYVLARAGEQDENFLYFISTDKRIVKKLSLYKYMDIDPDSGTYFLNAYFATSNDGSRFLIMRPSPKKSYSLDLNTTKWETLNIQGNCFNASWSPDKKTIALECFTKGLSEIYFYDTVSKSLEVVTDCLEKRHNCGLPNWSVDGRWLAYIRAEGKSGPQTINGIYMFDTDCVQNNNCMEIQTGPMQSDSNPVWSSDNKLIFGLSGIINSFDPNNRILERTSINLPDGLSLTIKGSPDGKYLAFISFLSSTIYLHNKETNNSDVLLENQNILSIIGWIVIP